MILSLPEIARALGGEIHGNYVLAPGPGHSRRDRSLSIRLSDVSPDGFVVHSHAGDDWRECRDYVADALGLSRDRWRAHQELDPDEIERRRESRCRAEQRERAETERRRRRAIGIWNEGREPRGSVVEKYLNARGLDLPDAVAGTVLRFHPRCPWETTTVPAMVAAIRCICTARIIGVHRTALDDRARKVGRKVYGSAASGAVMLDSWNDVETALTVGEGIETSLTAYQLGLRPVWSLINTGNIGALPPLPGFERLTVLAEVDTSPNRPSATACRKVGERWHAAGRHVDLLHPPEGCGDLNDALRRDAR